MCGIVRKDTSTYAAMIVLTAVLAAMMSRGSAAETPDIVWVRGMGSPAGEYGRDIAVDASGNVYTTGRLQGTIDFDPGPGTTNLTTAGLSDIFVLKLDASGNLLWARAMGGTGDDWAEAIAVDSSGNVYTTGRFSGTADFDPGAGTVNLTSVGSSDIFVQKLDSSGNLVWARAMGGTAFDQGAGVAVDGNGNVYTTGLFSGTADFDPGAGTVNLASAGSFDIFVQKLDSSGNLLWARAMGGTSFDIGHAVAVDGVGNVYTTGQFQSTVDFDPGAGTANLSSGGGTDIFVQKLDASGNLVWDLAMGGVGNDAGFAFAIDGLENVYATGVFQLTADFDPGPGTTNLTTDGNGSIFVVKLDQTPPTVSSIVRADANPTNAASVAFTVTFSEAVDNATVGGGDFTVAATGVAGASVTGVTGTADTYTVTVNTGTGDGTVGLNLVDDDSILDLSGLPLGGTGVNNGDFTTGEVYTIDRTPPGISIGAPSATDTSGGPVSYTVTYTGAAAVNLTMGAISLNSPGTASASVGVANGTTSSPTVTLSGITGDGTLGISINAGTSSDAVGNIDEGAGPSATFNVDNTPPGVSIGAPSATDTSGGPVSYTITYSGATSVNLLPGNVTLGATGATATVGVANGTTSSPTVTLSGITGDGTLGISINAGTSSDVLGNTDLGAGPSPTFNVDNTAPLVTVSSLTTSDSRPALMGSIDDAGATVSVTVDGQINTATNNGATRSLADNTLSTLAAGTYDVQVTATDAVGNVGADATSNELTIQSSGSGGGQITSNLTPEEMIEGARLDLTAPGGFSAYQWKKDGVPLADGGSISGSATQVLVIDPLALVDGGVYTCQYEDGIARAVVETDGFVVVVLGAVSLPTANRWALALLLLATGFVGSYWMRKRGSCGHTS